MCDMSQRTETVTLRLTPEELVLIDQAAEAEGRDRSGLIRRAISQYLTPEKRNQ